MNMAAARRALRESLGAVGIGNASGEADLILMHTLGVSRAEILGHPERVLTDPQFTAVWGAAGRRRTGEPLQYILNEASFWGLTFQVGKGVLVPRPETELLVELALEHLAPSSPQTFLDWGTGSGCVAVALLYERPCAKAFMAEKNPRSLRWARKNLALHKLGERALLRRSREFEDIPVDSCSLDLVVANPPYIPTEEIENLMREVRDHEPWMALDGGRDGLDFYRALFRYAPGWLKPRGALVLEIGDAKQAEALQAMTPPTLRFVKTVTDYAGIPRCMAWTFEPMTENGGV
jgi:release factor glutamine methyltransferase